MLVICLFVDLVNIISKYNIGGVILFVENIDIVF